MDEKDLAYMAGLFDGEGCVGIVNRDNRDEARKHTQCRPRISMNQKDGKVIDWVYEKFGGYVGKRRDNDKSEYYWYMQDNAAYYLLDELRPYLKVKDKQADLIFEFMSRKGKGILTNRKGKYISDKEIKIRQKIREELKESNHIYRESMTVKNKKK